MPTKSRSRVLLLVCSLFPFIPSGACDIQPEVEIIDIHGHIGAFEGFDLSTETLLANVNRYRIRMVLVSNIDGAKLPQTANTDERTTNNKTLDFVRRESNRFRGLIWTRPTDGSPGTVEPFLRERAGVNGGPPAFVGLKIHPVMNSFPADDPRVDGYLELCAKYGIPAVVHCDKPGTKGDPERIYAAARRHPGVPVVLYHMVFKGPHNPAIEIVRKSIRNADARLYLETAQAEPTAVVRAVRELGSERVLFGTDATYYGKEHYRHYEAMIETLKKELPRKDFENVMGKNARRLFRLE